MLRDSTVDVVRTRPRAVPLAMVTMRKSTHGFPFVSYIGMGLRRSSAIIPSILTLRNILKYLLSGRTWDMAIIACCMKRSTDQNTSAPAFSKITTDLKNLLSSKKMEVISTIKLLIERKYIINLVQASGTSLQIPFDRDDLNYAVHLKMNNLQIESSSQINKN